MKSFSHIAKREFRLLFHNKSMFIFAVILPFISIVFFNTLLKEGVARDLPIAIVDLDNSSISRNFISQLDATPELKVSFIPLNQFEGEKLVKLSNKTINAIFFICVFYFSLYSDVN